MSGSTGPGYSILEPGLIYKRVRRRHCLSELVVFRQGIEINTKGSAILGILGLALEVCFGE